MKNMNDNFNLNKSGKRIWKFTAKRKDGSVKWVEECHNLVVNVALQKSIDDTLLNGSQSAVWYVGLTATTPTPAAGDTMASHAGWTEWPTYDEAVRQTWTGVRSGQVVTNAASVATVTSSSDTQTVGGAFLVDNSTKSGSSGTLFCVAAFTLGDKSLDTGETLDITYQITAADDGV